MIQEGIIKKYDNMEAIRKEVEGRQNILTLTMLDLRDAYGKGKLGVHVLSGISKALAGLGLGHFPKELPNSQNAFARIYKLGSPVGEMIDAVLTPNEKNDEILRQKSAGDDAEVLKQVREIVCP